MSIIPPNRNHSFICPVPGSTFPGFPHAPLLVMKSLNLVSLVFFFNLVPNKQKSIEAFTYLGKPATYRHFAMLDPA